MSGQTSAGMPSRFHLETEALDTLRGAIRSESRSASLDVPPTAWQADSRGVGVSESMVVSEDDTVKSSFPILSNRNKPDCRYAHQMGFGDRLRAARKALGLTGDHVGSQLGVSKQTISHWEGGRHEPNIEQIRGLCNVLKVTPNYLFEADDLNLPPDAIEEAQAYAKLSADDRRRWRTLRKTVFSTVE
jgi:transcriptional regulator with XRE-family HTH domain